MVVYNASRMGAAEDRKSPRRVGFFEKAVFAKDEVVAENGRW